MERIKMGIEINSCPFCGGTELIHGEPTSYGTIYGENMLQGCVLHYIICRQCGSVVHSYVDNPELLLKRKNRRSK